MSFSDSALANLGLPPAASLSLEQILPLLLILVVVVVTAFEWIAICLCGIWMWYGPSGDASSLIQLLLQSLKLSSSIVFFICEKQI